MNENFIIRKCNLSNFIQSAHILVRIIRHQVSGVRAVLLFLSLHNEKDPNENQHNKLLQM